MNAGCYGTETWEQIVDCVTVDRKGNLHTRVPADFDIAYRHVEAKTATAEEFFVSARFLFRPGNAEVAQARIKELLAKRMASQPIDKPNAGSTFRNPPGDHAARAHGRCRSVNGRGSSSASVNVPRPSTITVAPGAVCPASTSIPIPLRALARIW
jgi:UDP-N-acetylmuramate dehydrogenase